MIIGFLGQAGSGKDTAADHLVRKHRFTKISLADPMKRFCQAVFQFTDEQLWGPSEMRNAPDPRWRLEDPDRRSEETKLAFRRLHTHSKGWIKEVFPNESAFDVSDLLRRWLLEVTSQNDVTPRYALQTLGTEVGRKIDDMVWTAYALKQAKAVISHRRAVYTPQGGIQHLGWLKWLFSRKSTEHVVIPDVRFKNEVAKLRSNRAVVIRLRRAGKDGVLGAGVAGHQSEEEQKSIPDSSLDYVIKVPEGVERFKKEIDIVYAVFALKAVFEDIGRKNGYDRMEPVEKRLRDQNLQRESWH